MIKRSSEGWQSSNQSWCWLCRSGIASHGPWGVFDWKSPDAEGFSWWWTQIAQSRDWWRDNSWPGLYAHGLQVKTGKTLGALVLMLTPVDAGEVLSLQKSAWSWHITKICLIVAHLQISAWSWYNDVFLWCRDDFLKSHHDWMDKVKPRLGKGVHGRVRASYQMTTSTHLVPTAKRVKEEVGNAINELLKVWTSEPLKSERK